MKQSVVILLCILCFMYNIWVRPGPYMECESAILYLFLLIFCSDIVRRQEGLHFLLYSTNVWGIEIFDVGI